MNITVCQDQETAHIVSSLCFTLLDTREGVSANRSVPVAVAPLRADEGEDTRNLSLEELDPGPSSVLHCPK